MDKIQTIMRQEIEAIGGQEITMPVVQPADLWKKTGRWEGVGPELGRFRDRSRRDMALAMTHEEVVAALAHEEVHSYRQLPALVYHLQTKWRDDARPRAGLIRTREFTMLDSYSLDRDENGLEEQYRAHYQAYFNIFGHCALPVTTVESDVGVMGGSMAHEFMYLTSIGEDTLLLCSGCGYAANRQVARFVKPVPEPEEPKPMEKVATPNAGTIEALTRLLDIPRSRTAKAVFMVAEMEESEKLTFAVVRGDMEMNETRLANAVKANALRPARPEEIRAIGAEPGYGSPVGVKGALVVVDDAVPGSPNLFAGANEEGFHLSNVNYGRDFEAEVVADIASARSGAACPVCGRAMRAERGVEVGNTFKLGTRYSEALAASFLDEGGESRNIVMGSYGIGVGRLLACIAEEHHDEDGLVWPISVAPYQVHIVTLEALGDVAENLYGKLAAEGVEVLYDDREESLGVKFKDADLIGMPIRLTVTPRSLKNGGVEIKLRRTGESSIVPPEEVVSAVLERISSLEEKISSGVKLREP